MRPRPVPAPLQPLFLGALLLSGACSGSGGGGASPPSTAGLDLLSNPFLGPKKVLLIPAGFSDLASKFEVSPAGFEELRAIASDVHEAFLTDSYGQVDMVFDPIWPPIVLAKTEAAYLAGTAPLLDAREDLLAEARALGFEAADYDREVLLLPSALGGRAAQGWGRTVWMSHKLTWVLFHELGHTLGRPHANFWNGDPVGAGKGFEYGDVYDPMGSGQTWTRFHEAGPWFKWISGWLTDADVLEVTHSGTYALSPLESADGSIGPTALRIRRNANEEYWLFHRITEESVRNGPLVVRATNDPFHSPLLLDMNPTGDPDYKVEVTDASLSRGATFEDAAAGIRVKNVTTEGQPITLEVTVDEAQQAGLDDPPIVDVLSPPRDVGPIGGAIPFQVVAYDPEVGAFDGAGIERVKLDVLSPVSDTFEIVQSTELLARPFAWTVDGAELGDGFYYLQITAEGRDGGSTVSLFRFIVEAGAAPVPDPGA